MFLLFFFLFMFLGAIIFLPALFLVGLGLRRLAHGKGVSGMLLMVLGVTWIVFVFGEMLAG